MSLYRGERWELSYGVEATYGAAPAAGLTATNLFGVFETATLADPDFEHRPYWFMNPASRNYTLAYKGRARCSGSVPDVILLDGRPLFLPLTDTIVHAGSGTYTHTIDDSSALSSIRLVATNYPETSTTAGLVRWYVGGKVNRATYHCEEGGMLMMSLDEIMFKMPYFADDDATNISPWYDADAVKQSLTLPSTEPYYFSQGALKIKLAKDSLSEIAVPTLRNFRLEVNNNLDPKYYIMTNDEKVPYEIHEGRREYRCSFTIDLVDVAGGMDKNDFFLELMNQGSDTTLKGAGIEFTFTRGASDTIRFRIPGDYTPTMASGDQGGMIIRAPMNIVSEGVISIPVEMIVPDVQILVTDSLSGSVYPV